MICVLSYDVFQVQSFNSRKNNLYFDSMEFLNINGKIFRKEEAWIKPDDHSYRYGDGLFETMKVADGKIFLSPLHFERLFHGFDILKFRVPDFFLAEKLEAEVIEL